MVLKSQYGVLTRTRTYNYCISRQCRVERGMYSIDRRRREEEFTYARVCVRVWATWLVDLTCTCTERECKFVVRVGYLIDIDNFHSL